MSEVFVFTEWCVGERGPAFAVFVSALSVDTKVLEFELTERTGLGFASVVREKEDNRVLKFAGLF